MNPVLAWRPQHRPDMGRGFALALGAHALLVVGLKLSLDWRTSSDSPALEAELWAAVPQAAAPRAVEVPPPPPPAEAPRPQPQPKVDDGPSEAEIRVQRERAQKERAQREAARKAEREQQARAQREQAERAQREKHDRQERAEREAKAAEQQREKLRQDQLRRMQGLAGASGSETATGTATQSAGPSASYAGRVMAQVRPNIRPLKNFPAELRTEVLLRMAPDGTIIASTVRRSSGDPEWDEEALRAVQRTGKLPLDNGTVPRELLLIIRPVN